VRSIFEHLFRLRLVVARHGEMDRARWWNAKGVLGMRGKTVLGRGFPRTALFAQARVAFAVARARCDEAFDAGDDLTLFGLPTATEDQFDAALRDWLDDPEPWRDFLREADQPEDADLIDLLCGLGLIAEELVRTTKRLHTNGGNLGICLGNSAEIDHDALSRLGAAFSLGKPGYLMVPYMRLVPPAHA
jgi:hypothetical protein